MLKKSLLILTAVSSIYAANNDIQNNNFDNENTKKEDKTKSLLPSELFSTNQKQEKFQIVANNVNAKGNIITAEGNVVIFSPTYYITAKKVIYDKDNSTFELFDDVIILKDNNLQSHSNYAFVNMDKEDSIQHPLLMLNKSSLLWINASKSEKKKNNVDFENAILSSCNCDDPAWSIKFSSANYDTDNQWLQTFNSRLYLGSVPVFYIPYFAFPTDTTRRTGLLFPTIGYSNTEGILYTQPIFIAPSDNFDVELIPQIKTKRGEGLYSYFRYADSKFSTLYFSAGGFIEKDKYAKENELINEKHFGYSVNYIRDNIFSNNSEHQDGLLVNIDWVNDIEYKNLENDLNSKSYAKKLESKINYFYKTPNYYSGIYFRHYLDTSLSSNETTMQQLPQAQFHKFSTPLFFDKVMLSSDIKYTNYYRENGINASRLDLSVPIYYSFSILDDYLKFTLKNETTSSHLNYSDTANSYENGDFIENKTIFTLGSDLIKPYDDYIHTINFNSDFTIPKTVLDEGDLFGITNSNTELNPFPVIKTKKTLAFSLNHSFYDREDLRQIINHKIKQSIIYDEFNDTSLSDFENEITFNYILGQISNRLVYSQEDNTLIESSSRFRFKYDDYFFNATYYLSKQTENSGKSNLESYTLETGFDFMKDYRLSYLQNYNVEKQIRSSEAIKLNIDDKCWSFSVKYGKELIASNTVNYDPIREDTIYFTFELKQLAGINYDRKIRDTKVEN